MASSPIYAGEVLTAALLASIAPLGVVKPATQAASNNTLANDTDLLAALTGSATYALFMQVGYNGGTPQGSADLKLGWSVPSGATLNWGAAYLDTSGAAHWSQFLGNAGQIVAGTNGASVNRQLWVVGSVVMGSSAGTLQLQWAQGTSNGTATQVLAGSWLAMWRLS